MNIPDTTKKTFQRARLLPGGKQSPIKNAYSSFMTPATAIYFKNWFKCMDKPSLWHPQHLTFQHHLHRWNTYRHFFSPREWNAIAVSLVFGVDLGIIELGQPNTPTKPTISDGEMLTQLTKSIRRDETTKNTGKSIVTGPTSKRIGYLYNKMFAIWRTNKWQAIYHASHCKKRIGGLNSWIPDHWAKVTLAHPEIFKKGIKKFPKGYISVVDITGAFGHTPIMPHQHKYLGLFMGGMHWRYTNLPYGVKTSPILWCLFSTALTHIIRSEYKHRKNDFIIGVYVDDCFIFTRNKKFGNEVFLRLITLASELGFRLSAKKTKPPSRVTTLLGMEVDMKMRCIRITKDKQKKYLEEMNRLEKIDNENETWTLKDIERMTGRLNWIGQFMTYGQSRLTSFHHKKTTLQKLSNARNNHHY